jgi:hypothetical protein
LGATLSKTRLTDAIGYFDDGKTEHAQAATLEKDIDRAPRWR